MAAFAAPRPSAPKRVYDSTRPAEPQAKRLRDNSLDAKDESSADTAVVETITCVECNARFNFTEGEERFFKEKSGARVAVRNVKTYVSSGRTTPITFL